MDFEQVKAEIGRMHLEILHLNILLVAAQAQLAANKVPLSDVKPAEPAAAPAA